jgi:hypothetical protein
MAEGLATESQKAHQMEANLEKTLSDFDTERERLKLKLSREENKNKELSIEVEKLKYQIELLQKHTGQDRLLQDGPKSIEIKTNISSNGSSPIMSDRVASPTLNTSPRSQVGKGYKSPTSLGAATNVPVVHVRNSPVGAESAPLSQKPHVDPSSPVKRALKSFDSPSRVTEQTANRNTSESFQSERPTTKPIPAEKPPELQATKLSQPGSSVLSMSGGTTVFTTPSGTRISLNVGPSNAFSSGGSARPVTQHSKANPPPVPPNKPQGYIKGTTSPLPTSPTPGVTPVPVHHTTSKLSPRLASMPFITPRPTPPTRDIRKPPPQVSLFK